MSITALILDYGEVLSQPQSASAIAAMARVFGVDEQRMHDAYWALRQDYDLGLRAEEYWQRTAGMLGLPTLNDAQIEALVACDIASWTDFREEMWELTAWWRARGGRTAFLSNGVHEIMARIRAERPLDRWFDAVVVSCEIGIVKPDPAIYALCLDRLGVAADAALFVDDRSANTAAAAALGIQTLTFSRQHTVDDVRTALNV
jgi:putative hydrolase of the HAD superfamily